jgi:hypothetical protein
VMVGVNALAVSAYACVLARERRRSDPPGAQAQMTRVEARLTDIVERLDNRDRAAVEASPRGAGMRAQLPQPQLPQERQQQRVMRLPSP